MTSPIRTVAKAGFAAFDRLRSPFPGPRILIYHQIGAGHGRQMDVETDAFLRHLDWLESTGKRVVPLEEAIARRGEPDAAELIVLTFDDGYDDMYRNGFAALAARRLPFTLYITTAPVETRAPLSDERLSTPLTWDQINEMQDSGLMTIGAHTHAHPDLRHLAANEIRQDLERSDELIESRTGVRPTHFAYPWGYWSADSDQIVRARYASAVLGGGSTNEAGTDPFLVHRVPIQLSDGVQFFKHKLQRGQRTEEAVRRRVTGYEGP